MKIIPIIVLLCMITWLAGRSQNVHHKFYKSTYYSIMSSGRIKKINAELNLLNSDSITGKEAYEGALLMRKAGLVKLPTEKLKLFKVGRIKLETSLLTDSTNGEYHFLRLMIQENAPKIVKYHNDLEIDKLYIEKSFKSLSPVVQNAIINYSKNSKILNSSDLIR